jgi:hypothetical protein
MAWQKSCTSALLSLLSLLSPARFLSSSPDATRMMTSRPLQRAGAGAEAGL